MRLANLAGCGDPLRELRARNRVNKLEQRASLSSMRTFSALRFTEENFTTDAVGQKCQLLEFSGTFSSWSLIQYGGGVSVARTSITG
jgi:hypothetical protein